MKRNSIILILFILTACHQIHLSDLNGIWSYCLDGEYNEAQFLDSTLFWRMASVPAGVILDFTIDTDSIHLKDYPSSGKISLINKDSVTITFPNGKGMTEIIHLSRIANNPEQLTLKELHEQASNEVKEKQFLERAKKSNCIPTEKDTLNKPNLGDIDVEIK